MLGVGRLHGFSLTCVMTRPDGGTEKMTYTTTTLGLLGLPWSDLTKKAWDQTLTHLRLPGLKLGDDSRNTQLLHLVVKEVLCPSELRSN